MKRRSEAPASAWLTLSLAGLFEVGRPLGLKLGRDERGFQAWRIVFAALSMTISGVLLIAARRGIPIRTAHAVRTGIGAAGTFLLGVWFFGRSRDARASRAWR